VNSSENRVGFRALYGLWVIAASGVVLGLVCMLLSRRYSMGRARKNRNFVGDALPHPATQHEKMTEMVPSADGDDVDRAELGGMNGETDAAGTAAAAARWRNLVNEVNTSRLQVKEDLLGTESTWECGDTKSQKKLSMTR